MKTFEFKYLLNRRAQRIFYIAWLLGIPGVLWRTLMVQFNPLFFAMQTAGLIIGFAVLVYLHIKLKRTGTGVLHDQHVEINLDGRKYSFNYTEIEKIDEKKGLRYRRQRCWHIHVYDRQIIVIWQGVYTKPHEFCQLELFMMELRKRV